MTFKTRFAPSPTGPLHLGHAYSAMLAHDMALEHNGTFLLRIEDIDKSRARPGWEAQIYDDLEWLGLSWPEPVMRQSDRLQTYETTLKGLWKRNALYQCKCTRRDIANAMSAPQEGVAAQHGPDGFVYPGTCRSKAPFAHEPMPMTSLRLKMSDVMNDLVAAHGLAPTHFRFYESGCGPNNEMGAVVLEDQDMLKTIGDIVLARKDMRTSYHLSVVLDDAAQGITHIVRGQDLFEATKIHVILQRLLGLPTPIYHHHKLIRDEGGKRLAKRDDARAISKYRADGLSPEDVRELVGLAS